MYKACRYSGRCVFGLTASNMPCTLGTKREQNNERSTK